MAMKILGTFYAPFKKLKCPYTGRIELLGIGTTKAVVTLFPAGNYKANLLATDR